MKKIDLYLAQPISIMGENGTSYELTLNGYVIKEGVKSARSPHNI